MIELKTFQDGVNLLSTHFGKSLPKGDVVAVWFNLVRDKLAPMEYAHIIRRIMGEYDTFPTNVVKTVLSLREPKIDRSKYERPPGLTNEAIDANFRMLHALPFIMGDKAKRPRLMGLSMAILAKEERLGKGNTAIDSQAVLRRDFENPDVRKAFDLYMKECSLDECYDDLFLALDRNPFERDVVESTAPF